MLERPLTDPIEAAEALEHRARLVRLREVGQQACRLEQHLVGRRLRHIRHGGVAQLSLLLCRLGIVVSAE